MDSITQITLGAAVGELTLGKKVGNKAALWGGAVGLLPDLDILAAPFMDSVSLIGFHRSFSHSLLFAIMLAPLLGRLIYKIYKTGEGNWRKWSVLVFWVMITHIFLDCLTSYGTQLFWPFSRDRIAINTVAVIDPFYTIPFVLFVVLFLFFHRTSNKRRYLNYAGIGVSTLYLTFTAVNKLYVNSVFHEQLNKNDIQYSRILTSPTPFNNFLWRGVAETKTGFYEGYYSILDDGENIQFEFVEQNDQLLEPFRRYSDIRKLLWINKGFYAMSVQNGHVYMHDMRYGRMTGWRKLEGEFVYSFKISRNGGTEQSLTVQRKRPEININRSLILSFANRVFGN